MDPKVYICECRSFNHQAIFYRDKEENRLYVSIHLVTHKNILKRIWYSIKYIFGYTSVYGCWDEFIFDPKDEQRLLNYITG